MSNMSYCRFQNTLSDLEDCLEHLHDAFGKHDNDRREHAARRRIAELCVEVAEMLEDEDLEPADLGTDKDSNASVECEACGDTVRAGLVDAEGRCEDCTEELVDEDPSPAPDMHPEAEDAIDAAHAARKEGK